MTATETSGPDATEPDAAGRAGAEGAAGSRPDEPTGGAAGDGEAGGGEAGGGLLGDRAVARLALGLTLLPLAAAAVMLVTVVGGDYHPLSDHALTEMQVRSVGRDEVLVGLYSRDVWNHPGPALFYLLAPFYWLTGGLSVGVNLGALAINGAAVAGMGLLARRRGGTPLLLVTLLGNALLMRMLGAEFLRDPWNCFVTTLPFGLLVFLAWSMWQGDTWAFPLGAVVTTYLAQTHVGFVLLATPLFAWGAAGLVVGAWREHDGAARSEAVRERLRAGAIGAVVLALGWLPPALDALRHSPANIREIVDWFRHPEGEPHTLAEGWRVMSAQFGGAPEWLTTKREFSFGGQSPFIADAPLPWMLVLLVAAGVLLWRRGVDGVRTLLTTLGLAFVIGVVAVARTVGFAFDYRLRWTYIPAMVGLIIIGWATWTAVTGRWPRSGARVLRSLLLAGLAVLGAVNTVTAVTSGTPQGDDSESVAALTGQVLDELPDDPGTVLVTDAGHSGAWHARGLVLQLERRGFDVGVEQSRADQYGRHRVVDPAEADTVLVVSMDRWIDDISERPGARQIAEWYARPPEEIAALEAEWDAIGAEMASGEVSYGEGSRRQLAVAREMTNGSASMAYRAAVFVVEGGGAAPGA